MSEIAHHLKAMIREGGPISLASYMAVALGHPGLGYYRRQDPLGAAGDFITAPEISQMFGELIGLWCVQRWRDMGSPGKFMLCELGPGRGTLMADALRAAQLAPDFLAAAQIHLVETSEALRQKQKAAISRPVTWRDSVEGLPSLPAIFIANEFFDALPICQFQKCGDAWHERRIAIDPSTDGLCYGLSPYPLADADLLPVGMRDAPSGAIAEICPAARSITHSLASHICAQGGCAIFADYGPAQSAPGDSFQAMRGHGFCDPLMAPGEADLTAHVDFQSLAQAAEKAGCTVDGPIAQGQFLCQLGIAQRAKRLAQNATVAEQAAIRAALHRLTDADQMGTLFKAMALRHPALSLSPGFA